MRLKKLNQTGFDHIVLPVLVIVAVALVGTLMLMRSLAATPSGVELTSSVNKNASCLDDWQDADKTPGPNRIDLFACNKTKAQAWTVSEATNTTAGGTITNNNGLCLDVLGGKKVNYTVVDLYKCNGQGNQKWSVKGATIVNPVSGLCLDDRDASAANGNVIDIYKCNGTNAQKWTAKSTSTTTTTTTTSSTSGSTSTGTGSSTTTPPATTTSACSGGTSTALAVYVCNGQLVNGKGQAVQLKGVDVTGTEDACIQDKGFSWGASSTVAEDNTSAAALKSWDVTAVRIPLNEDCWLDINGSPAAYSGANYQSNLKNWVTALNNAGIYTILDLHWSAPGSTQATQQWPMADADHSITFWSQVAAAYKTDPAVVFDLFNEPYIGGSYPSASSWSCWLNGCSDQSDAPASASDYKTAGMQQMVNAVRSAGATQPIMVGGLNWAGNPCQSDGNSAQTCPQLSNMPKDSLSPAQLVVSLHSYQQDTIACTNTACWNNLASTMKAAKMPVVAGEIGEQDNQCDYIQSFMDWADQQTPKFGYMTWAWQTGGGQFDLINDWSGTPGGPEGAAVKSHLLGQGNVSC